MLKQFDQEKQKINSIEEIFDARIETLRSSIVDQSTALIYQTEFEVIGRKCREILWFKGYYDLISLAKRLWKKNQQPGGIDKRAEDQISNLIIEGISHFKLVIVNLERKFSLDLRDVVDFSFLDTYEKNLYTAVANQNGISRNENRSQDEETKYAMETIHSLLISLGDLHRYFIDFDFAMPKISKVKKYFESFMYRCLECFLFFLILQRVSSIPTGFCGQLLFRGIQIKSKNRNGSKSIGHTFIGNQL